MLKCRPSVITSNFQTSNTQPWQSLEGGSKLGWLPWALCFGGAQRRQCHTSPATTATECLWLCCHQALQTPDARHSASPAPAVCLPPGLTDWYALGPALIGTASSNPNLLRNQSIELSWTELHVDRPGTPIKLHGASARILDPTHKKLCAEWGLSTLVVDCTDKPAQPLELLPW